MGYWWMWKGGPNSSKDLHSEAREKLTSTDANISASWWRWMIFFRCIMGIQWFLLDDGDSMISMCPLQMPWNPDPLNVICVHKFKLRYSEGCASNSRTPRKVSTLACIILYQCLKSTTLSPWYWSSLHSFYSSFRRFHSPSHPISMILTMILLHAISNSFKSISKFQIHSPHHTIFYFISHIFQRINEIIHIIHIINTYYYTILDIPSGYLT
jgi:hypothetical protein